MLRFQHGVVFLLPTDVEPFVARVGVPADEDLRDSGACNFVEDLERFPSLSLELHLSREENLRL